MAFRTQKISQMTPKGADLEATDLIEVSTIESGSYVTRSITGQELIDAIPAPSGFVPTSRTLTINGVTQDLSADRTFTIATGLTVGTTPIASGTIGRVLFQGTGNVLQQSSSLSFDSATNRFQVGSNVNILAANTFPTNLNSPYVVLGPYNANFGGDQGALFNLTNNSTTGNSAAIFRFGITSPATGAIGEFGATSSTFSGFPSLVFFNTKGTFPLAFLTNDTERLRIHGTTGNIGINTTTDAGFRLDVNGTARVSGLVTATLSNYNSTHSGNTTRGFYIVNSADSIVRGGIEYDGTNAFVQLAGRFANGAPFFRQDGGNGNISFLRNGVEFGRFFGTGNLLIQNGGTYTDAGFRLDVNGTARVKGDFIDLDSTNNERFKITDNASVGNSYTFLKRFDNTKDIFHVIFPSGTLTTSNVNWNFGIKGNTNNFSIASYDGGASATERLVITNTGNVLIGTTTNGASKLRIVGLPTSPAGLSSGDIWNNLGILTIV